MNIISGKFAHKEDPEEILRILPEKTA